MLLRKFISKIKTIMKNRKANPDVSFCFRLCQCYRQLIFRDGIFNWQANGKTIDKNAPDFILPQDQTLNKRVEISSLITINKVTFFIGFLSTTWFIGNYLTSQLVDLHPLRNLLINQQQNRIYHDEKIKQRLYEKPGSSSRSLQPDGNLMHKI